MTSVVYFVQRADGDVKIGCSAFLRDRMINLCNQHGALTLLGTMEGDRFDEQATHTRFAAYRRAGRKPNKPTEWFAPAADLLDYIAENTWKPPLRQSRYAPDPKRQVVRVARRREQVPNEDGVGLRYLPTPNKVQTFLRERYGDLSSIRKRQLCEESGFYYHAVDVWLGGYVTHAELRTVEKWARFLNCPISELIEDGD